MEPIPRATAIRAKTLFLCGEYKGKIRERSNLFPSRGTREAFLALDGGRIPGGAFQALPFHGLSGKELSMMLEAKVALITGAAGGIGKAIALAFASEGAEVVLVDLPGTPLEAVAKEVREVGRTA
jgi:hypothetical protein